MEQVLIFHNPGAGDSAHSKEALIDSISKEGYKYKYQSVKDEKWDSFTVNDADLLVVAGGDGTVRKVLQYMDSHKSLLALPVALIPLGTANNVATSLHIRDHGKLPAEWRTAPCIGFDINRIINGNEDIMIESFGAGLFANHMRKMTKNPASDLPADERIINDIRNLLEHAKKEKPQFYSIELDGRDYSDEYIMVEVMNTPMLGPNLTFAPDADPGDGLLDVILITDRDRRYLEAYLSQRITDEHSHFLFTPQRASNITIKSGDSCYHLDDKLTVIDVGGVEISSCKHKIRMLV